MKDALLLLFQMSTNAQALLMTAIQMRFVLTQMVHSLVAATLDIPGMANNARVCFFFFFITIKLYYSRFKFVLFWYQWPFTAFLFFFNYRVTISVCQGNHAFKDRAFLDFEVFMKPLSWIAFLHCRTRLRASALACGCLLAIFLEIQWLAKSHIFDSQQDTSNLHDLS